MTDNCRVCFAPDGHCACDQPRQPAENGGLCSQCGCDLLHEESGFCYVCARANGCNFEFRVKVKAVEMVLRAPSRS
jgi:hypothetical protein